MWKLKRLCVFYVRNGLKFSTAMDLVWIISQADILQRGRCLNACMLKYGCMELRTTLQRGVNLQVVFCTISDFKICYFLHILLLRVSFQISVFFGFYFHQNIEDMCFIHQFHMSKYAEWKLRDFSVTHFRTEQSVTSASMHCSRSSASLIPEEKTISCGTMFIHPVWNWDLVNSSGDERSTLHVKWKKKKKLESSLTLIM